MSYSKAAICNIALGHIGINRAILDLDADGSAQGLACRTNFTIALETTLRAHRWSFAKRTATLATISGYSSNAWAYAYRLPSDFLYAASINRSEADPSGEPYEMGGDTSGPVLYTNAEDAELDYIANVTLPGLYPADFVDALAAQLASRIAQPLAAIESLRQAAESLFRGYVTRAMADQGNESVGLEPEQSAFLAARGYADGGA